MVIGNRKIEHIRGVLKKRFVSPHLEALWKRVFAMEDRAKAMALTASARAPGGVVSRSTPP
jgi:hypothetical protein